LRFWLGFVEATFMPGAVFLFLDGISAQDLLTAYTEIPIPVGTDAIN
jgi:hypothetical protein